MFDAKRIAEAAAAARKADGPRRKAAPATGGSWDVPGFGPMTRIATDCGDFPAQALRVGDRVRTRQGPIRPIAWLDRLLLDEAFLQRHPEALPVLIRQGALGPRLPARDIVVSPAQVVFAARAEPGARPKRAVELTAGPRALRKAETSVSYTVFHCGAPEEVSVEGVWMPVAP